MMHKIVLGCALLAAVGMGGTVWAMNNGEVWINGQRYYMETVSDFPPGSDYYSDNEAEQQGLDEWEANLRAEQEVEQAHSSYRGRIKGVRAAPQPAVPQSGLQGEHANANRTKSEGIHFAVSGQLSDQAMLAGLGGVFVCVVFYTYQNHHSKSALGKQVAKLKRFSRQMARRVVPYAFRTHAFLRLLRV